MKQILSIKLHSTVDVITNSSSELFICDTNKSKELVEEYLQKMLEFYNFDNKRPLLYEKVFGDIKVLDESNIDQFIDEYVIEWGYTSWKWDNVERPPNISDIYANFAKYKLPWDQNMEYNENIEKEREEKIQVIKSEWLANNGEKVKKDMIGKVLIFSQEDNSIPFELFDLIENKLSADRIHLG